MVPSAKESANPWPLIKNDKLFYLLHPRILHSTVVSRDYGARSPGSLARFLVPLSLLASV